MTEQEIPLNDGEDDKLGTIANALRQRFGDDAKTVARIQLDAADDASRADWQAIFDQLSR